VIDDLYISVVKGRYDQLKGGMQVDKGVDAPIKRGDSLGKIIFTDTETQKVVKTAPLYALQDVGEGGWFRGMLDSIQKIFTD